MKNIYKLSPRDAIQYFIYHRNDILSVEKGGKTNVSISMPTNRTAPDYKGDSITLKNLIHEAERGLQKRLDKREYAGIVENLRKAHEIIDYSHNLDSLVVYANDKFAAYTTLAIDTKEEVLIDTNFDIRPLYKARQQTKRYYVLVISKKIIRLLEMRDAQLIREVNNQDFPFENDKYFTTDKEKLAQDSFTMNLIKEFFNISDKRFHKYLVENNLPLVLAGDVKTVAYYSEMMDDDRTVIGRLHGSYEHLPIHELINHVYPIVKEYNQKKETEYLNTINEAQSAARLVVDFDEINKHTLQGNVQTLFVGDTLSLRGKMEGNYLLLDKPDQVNLSSSELTIPIINHNQKNGGKTVFLDDQLLSEYMGMVLIKRS